MRSAAAGLCLLLLAPLALACDGPPQIVAISPGRGVSGVRTNAPIRISFDRPVDQASVASRFRLVPGSTGQVSWETRQDLVFEHPPLRTDTDYQVLLDHGYRDLGGHVDGLDHHWRFRTEPAPQLVSSSPAPGESTVDPATLVVLNFSREMDATSLPPAISIRPGISPALRLDPADGRRVLIAPSALLQPHSTYTVTVTTGARDVDGNQIAHGAAFTFSSGSAQQLRHRLTFIAAGPGGVPSAGIWMVDESRFPRTLTAGAADTYTWSPDGTRLLARSASGDWAEQTVAGPLSPLALDARWAAYLGPGQGFAYLSGNDLWQHPARGADLHLAGGVTEAAVAPDGGRLAFVVAEGPTSQIWAYDVGLRSRYRLQVDAGEVGSLAWSPDGSRLAYLLASIGSGGRQLKVRSLTGSASTVTLATGALDGPVWQGDSRHLVFAAAVPLAGGGSLSKAFRLAVTDPPPGSLTVAMGLPAGTGISVISPQPSPDGHQIAFLSDGPGGRQVFLMNVDGTGLSQLTSFDAAAFPYSCRELAWTPA